jgi:hypothetical protein
VILLQGNGILPAEQYRPPDFCSWTPENAASERKQGRFGSVMARYSLESTLTVRDCLRMPHSIFESRLGTRDEFLSLLRKSETAGERRQGGQRNFAPGWLCRVAGQFEMTGALETIFSSVWPSCRNLRAE